jgi:hypothetical protein
VGTGLELAHGFKLAAYLDDDVTRLMLTLAHAHGVGLALVALAFASHATPIFEAKRIRAVWVAKLLRAGSVLLPLGFLLGAIHHPEGDPGVGIALAPVGALLVLVALITTATSALQTSSRPLPRG